ncbi:response regulator transcription factor [Paenibacillus radicis (ex Gao et al. 2016)]|uniref:DNA-binding response regulator n=1 Tax=Paenibacillus radicis (ex Gao et al. 2016) TaxID=1737354 RepID=A0A917M3S4_9BACL|nr:response regulator transcription factor [Paenibacillus radicis (ex Gao et al. 2016)]GGG75793.1 DNA-binding response regulator [Paenibacillus radicis (ex Gao et al. 2016)]
MYRIFIVEDDDKIGGILKANMEKYGFEVRRAERFKELLAEFIDYDPHLVLLDINLSYFDGFYWCRQIRTRSNVPIIFISARAGEMDQVMAIENGGDDYVAKPIHLDLLMAKVRGALRRVYGEYAAGTPGLGVGSGTASGDLEANGLTLYLSRNELEWQGKRVELTKNELLLAECFLRRPEHVVSREELLEALWDDVQFVDDNTLTVNVTRLRKKLEELGVVKAIETVRGQGYKLVLSDIEKGAEA